MLAWNPRAIKDATYMNHKKLPTIIQGGMGAGVSGWPLARAVSKAGQLGVVSGTGIDTILTRRLQMGDPGGHMRRGMKSFPIPGIVQRILDRYFKPGGKDKNKPFKTKPMLSEKPSRHLQELLVLSNFVEVFLAKEGHDGPVGINYLEKIQLPTLPSIYGAMLAGVTYVLIGAGIPKAIPGVLDNFAQQQPAQLRLDVKNTERGEAFTTQFDPHTFCEGAAPELDRPDFLAIISSSTLGTMLKKKSNGKVNGFIVEGPTAGGHNAPPRGQLQLSVKGEPIYGKRDDADIEAIKALGLPFWLAGSYAEPERLNEALRQGATGVQIGTAFAYCEESDIDTKLKEATLTMSLAGEARVITDPIASPTGFPFKVLQMEETHSDSIVYEQRTRVCDLGYLRHAYKKSNGKLGWRCPSEPVDEYVRKGGDIQDTIGRKCVCNGLMGNIALAQIQKNGELEKPFITSGDDVANVARFLQPGAISYRAVDVIQYLLRDIVSMNSEEQEEHAAA